MGEQWILTAGLVYAVVTTIGLIRLGRGEGGLEWAGAWTCLWVAGGVVLLAEVWPAVNAVGAALGTATATLFVAGSLRFTGRGVPRAFWAAAAGLALLRAALLPWVGATATEVMGALLLGSAALASSVLLLQPRRPDGTRRNRMLAASFPAAALSAGVYAGGMLTGAPSWIGVFLWLMAAILISGMQVLTMVLRIAERAERECALLASLIEAVPVGLALFEPEGALRATNPAFQKIVGSPDGTPIERETDVLGALAERVEPAEAEALQEFHGVARPDHELHFKNGLRVSVAVHPVTSNDGAPAGRLWLLRDVTEERRLQEDLERARRLETLGGFAGGVAHDFNNQLTSVLGNATLARETLAPGHPAHEILADLASSAEHCARLTRDVLDFARRGPARPVRIDPATLLPAILERHAAVGAALEVPECVPAIEADPNQLERVVANLLDNARQAAGADGCVKVCVRPAKHPGRVVLEVVDDGPGIEEAVRERIFEPFFTTKPVGQGSGLGLAIVYGIVTRQGGEVRIEGAPGEGTRIVTTWPTARDEP